MVDSTQWDKVLNIINSNEKFILTTHFNPDGDALGSEIALAEFLKQKGKRIWIINNTPTPDNYKFLDPENKITVFDSNRKYHVEILQNAEVIIIVDISDWERLNDLGKLFRQSPAPKICIDHHHIESKFADIDIIYEAASSTGELIYEFLSYNNWEIKGRLAEALYTCILTDTGSFRFSNTSAFTLKMASHLLEVGVNARSLYQEIYENNSPGKMALMGSALTGIHYECGGTLAWFVITQEMFRAAKAEKWDTEGFPEIPRTIKGVEVSLMFTELGEKKTKISIRSKGRIIINDIAVKFGGGGHNFAAGAVIDQPLRAIMPLVLEETKTIVSCQQ